MQPWNRDDALRARLRQRMLDKGAEIAAKLARVLAGKDVRLEELPPLGPDGKHMRLEERLRAYLDLVGLRRRLLETGDPRYGVCDRCGVELDLVSLEEMPWADRCQPCAHKPAGEVSA